MATSVPTFGEERTNRIDETSIGDADDRQLAGTEQAISNNNNNAFSRFASAFMSRISNPNTSGSSDTSVNNKSSRTPSPRKSPLKCLTPSPERSSRSNQEDLGGSSPSRQQRSNSIRLQVPNTQPPRAFLGAIPRQSNTTLSSFESSDDSCTNSEERRCFCGYYSESTSNTSGVQKKPGRCKFCRSRAKYVPGQRSFDATRIFGRKRERLEPRRAVSEDRRSDGQTTEDTSASTSSATTASSSFDRPSPSSRPHFFFSTPPFLRRQERLEIDPPSPNLLTVPSPIMAPTLSPVQSSGHGTTTNRDHGLRTPPAPPTTLQLRSRNNSSGNGSPRTHHQNSEERHITHRMAHEMPEYLVPPPRTAILGRAHTDPTSLYDNQGQGFSHSGYQHSRPQPTSPPPTYSEVMREQPPSASSRMAPPSYEEALHSRVADMRLSSVGTRSLSEERTAATSSSSYRSRNGRNLSRTLIRSSRAEEIPDIYWEQAARELDFCTCRKCQARYRQYFEEDPDPVGDALIPMETQVLMQEVLTDGIAFCSLM